MNDLLEYLESKGNSGVPLKFEIDDNIETFRILALLFADDTIILAIIPHDFQKCLNDFDI